MSQGSLSRVGLLVGLLLIVIPEPTTTGTGLAITAASVGLEGADTAGGV